MVTLQYLKNINISNKGTIAFAENGNFLTKQRHHIFL